ncbi:MAG: MinD/ParA family ATP-binding protein [Candidatus Helarchaeota archaeon]
MGTIVSIHSFRGGTGKSNITANLAYVTALNGKKVGVIDTDIQSPGIHVIFGLGNKKIQNTLNSYLDNKCKIDDVAYDVGKSLKLPANRLFMFPAALESDQIIKILREGYEVTMLSDGFRSVIESMNLDYLFVDTHPGLGQETFLSIAISDYLFVILRPDEQDYLGTMVTLELAKKLEVPNIYLIINKVLPKYDLNDVKKTIQKEYKVPVAGVIKFFEELADTASATVFIKENPNHEFSNLFKEIYRIISND